VVVLIIVLHKPGFHPTYMLVKNVMTGLIETANVSVNFANVPPKNTIDKVRSFCISKTNYGRNGGGNAFMCKY
jgi:hypothetical protein